MAQDSNTLTPRKEWWLLVVLASIQFTNLMDFVILMPLGPQLMRVFNISPQQFGLIVSSYTFSAGIVGFLGAMVVDRFDRKKTLLILYAGFGISNLLCALAPSFEFLVAARVVTGAFGGIMGATVFAIVGDVIPDIRRGAAMGTVMASFSLATVAGVPVGLFLANSFGWHIPFFMLAGTSSIVLVVGYFVLPSIRGHLAHRGQASPFRAFVNLLTHRNHINSFIFMSAMMFAGFSVIPYISPYMVVNVGLTEKDLPYIYFLGGAATMFTSRYFGRLTDRFGKQRTFAWVASFSMVPILVLTNLPRVPLWATLIVTTFFMIFTSGRMVPAMAMVTASVQPKQRGSFMSINSSIQQFSSGIASFSAGLILNKTSAGTLTNYGIVGALAVATSVLCIVLSRRIRSAENSQAVPSPQEVLFETV
ncbi:MAG: MFS transporter [Bacteroidota bacterium]|nr:MFS transporter [Bacteroidota bacterium]